MSVKRIWLTLVKVSLEGLSGGGDEGESELFTSEEENVVTEVVFLYRRLGSIRWGEMAEVG